MKRQIRLVALLLVLAMAFDVAWAQGSGPVPPMRRKAQVSGQVRPQTPDTAVYEPAQGQGSNPGGSARRRQQ